ncbi:MAG: Thioredoxin, partial [uncultured bacterium]
MKTKNYVIIDVVRRIKFFIKDNYFMVQLLDFYADWCGPCKIMTPVLEEVEKDLNKKLEVKKVDVEAEGAMAQEFGIFSIPTFV